MKLINRIVISSIATIALWVLIFAAFAFANWEANPAKWSGLDRGGVSFLCIMFGAFLFVSLMALLDD